ncbi:SLC25A45 isoform 13 [Pongo abelii]|uniref:SLC25A45 isoform 13 n=1 Tax=Pongo abelii TaxID=9601 RepID=A0A2J8TZC0_PONAB|nr:SLC25A45 isoform 7 [Pongo abelii]PNJ38369.1 SLC25A45 isoform 13 [Pongo abelii]
MPVEEFVAGWISGETFFFLLSHHTQWALQFCMASWQQGLLWIPATTL